MFSGGALSFDLHHLFENLIMGCRFQQVMIWEDRLDIANDRDEPGGCSHRQVQKTGDDEHQRHP
jgi:hypothetical protein